MHENKDAAACPGSNYGMLHLQRHSRATELNEQPSTSFMEWRGGLACTDIMDRG